MDQEVFGKSEVEVRHHEYVQELASILKSVLSSALKKKLSSVHFANIKTSLHYNNSDCSHVAVRKIEKQRLAIIQPVKHDYTNLSRVASCELRLRSCQNVLAFIQRIIKRRCTYICCKCMSLPHLSVFHSFIYINAYTST